MNNQICITGMGVCSAIGDNLDEFAANLRSGTSGIKEQSGIFPGEKIWAGLLGSHHASGSCQEVDRAAQIAWQAGNDAWSQALGKSSQTPNLSRVALILGTSHGGRSQIDHCLENEDSFLTPEAARRILKISPHFRQTEWVASKLGINGPVATISTACSSSSAAILHGIDLLNAGKADYVLAGGMDGFSKLTHAGFRALGAVADGACGPFSERVGISLGEGAAVVVLERFADAEARNATIWAELYGGGSSWDCYHSTEPHPAGEGLLRALEMAAHRAGLSGSRDFCYASLHGTGTRANDAAETIALKSFYGGQVPPASSVKSFTGHTLGASGAMGLIASVLGVQHGFLPPTVNFGGARAGCDLDYVPNESRPAQINRFSAQSAGFGGVNMIMLGGRPQKASINRRTAATGIAISGMGIVSAAGIGLPAFRNSLVAGRSGIGPIDRFDVSECSTRTAGMVRDFNPRKIAPTLNLRRADLCFQFAAVAVAEALADSKLAARGISFDKVGLVAGTTRGAVTSFEHCISSARGGAWDKTSAMHFPNLVMSSLGGYVSNMFKLKGVASTLVCGSGGGLQPVLHAAEMLRSNTTQEAIVVVLTDELSPVFYKLFDELGILSPMGEGAAAFVLERRDIADNSNDGLNLTGYGMTSDSQPQAKIQHNGEWFAESIRHALNGANATPGDIDLIFSHGGGCQCRETREIAALARVMDRQSPLCCVLPNTGFAESASAGFSLVAAGLSLRHQESYGMQRARETSPAWNFVQTSTAAIAPVGSVLLTASSESGNNAALVLSRSLAASELSIQ